MIHYQEMSRYPPRLIKFFINILQKERKGEF